MTKTEGVKLTNPLGPLSVQLDRLDDGIELKPGRIRRELCRRIPGRQALAKETTR
jgi:hypothetical protein